MVASMVALALWANLPLGNAPELSPGDPPAQQTTIDKLKAEALRIEGESLSPGLAKLGDRQTAPTDLSNEAVDLAQQLDKLSRDIIRTWLLNDLNRDPAPGEASLSARLGPPGKAFAHSVVTQAEAMAVEGLLTASQARKVQSTLRPPSGLLKGRYGPIPSTADKPPVTTADCVWALQSMAASLKQPSTRASELFGVLGGEKAVSLKLNPDQVVLIRRLDELTRQVSRSYLLRGLQGLPPRDQWEELPPAGLAARLSRTGDLVVASLNARAELILMEAVLDRDQAEKARLLLWTQRGITALLDPELGARLGLSKTQASEIFDRMVLRSQAVHRAAGLQAAAAWGVKNASELVANREIERLIGDADSSVLQVLSKKQLDMLKKILSEPMPARPKDSSKPAP